MTTALASEFPVKRVCAVLGSERSTHYYQGKKRDDEPLKAAIREVMGTWPTYGYRRVTAQLRREGWQVNGKRVLRVMRAMGVQGKVVVRKRRTTNSEHPFPRYPNLVMELAVNSPDQVWVADITYIRLNNDFVYLAVLMDVFTRSIRGWHLSRNLDAELTLVALRKALEGRKPQIHHSDQGVQYAASDYVRMLQNSKVSISMATVGEPTENGYAERLMRTIKEEEVDLSEYENYQDAYQQIGKFCDDVYNRKRIHSSIGYLTPAEHEERWIAQQAMLADVV